MNLTFDRKVTVTLTALLLNSVFIGSALSQPPQQGGRRGGDGGQGRQQQGRGVQRQNTGQQSSAANGTASQNHGMPGVMGTITNGDSATGRLLIQSQQNQANLVVQVTDTTEIVTQISVTVANLQVNDQVMIPHMGDGGAADASQRGGGRGDRGSNRPPSDSTGQRPAPPQDNGFRRGGEQTSGGNANSSQNSSRPNGNSGGRPPTTGRVTSLNPLTIASEGGDTVTVTLPADARVMKLVSLTFNDLKIGDRIMAMGQTDSNGVFVAARLGVNMAMGQNSRSDNGQGSPQNSQQNNRVRGGQGQRGGAQGGTMPQGRRGQQRNNS